MPATPRLFRVTHDRLGAQFMIGDVLAEDAHPLDWARLERIGAIRAIDPAQEPAAVPFHAMRDAPHRGR